MVGSCFHWPVVVVVAEPVVAAAALVAAVGFAAELEAAGRGVVADEETNRLARSFHCRNPVRTTCKSHSVKLTTEIG